MSLNAKQHICWVSRHRRLLWCCVYRKLPEIVRRWQTFRAEALLNGNAKELLSGRPPVGQNIKWIRAEVLQILQVGGAAGRCVVAASGAVNLDLQLQRGWP